MAKGKAASTGSSLLELVIVVVVALALALGIQAVLVKPYQIPTESMVPTLVEGQRVLVNRIGMRFGPPDVGDVVVFKPPRGAEEGTSKCGSEPPADQACSRPTPGEAESTFIKRLVGGPGDRIAIRDGSVYRNGKRVPEPYAEPCGGGDGCDMPKEITIPAGHYFMMGDNRGASDDSRFWGPVPRDQIIGRAFATYWPPSRIGGL